MKPTLETYLNVAKEELKLADGEISFKNKKSAIRFLELSRYNLNKSREILEHKKYKVEEEVIKSYDFNERYYTFLLDKYVHYFSNNGYMGKDN